MSKTSKRELSHTHISLRLNPIVVIIVLYGRERSNVKLHKVLNEIVLNLRGKFTFTVKILGNFALAKKYFLVLSVLSKYNTSPKSD